jgi:hypothetical protein
LLIPPALVKTASTGWRIVRYYSGSRPYRDAGPPPRRLRVLGPLVVLFTLAVLGSGVALILVRPDTARQPFASAAGFEVTVLMIHKATFVLWGIVTGAHTLGRLISGSSAHRAAVVGSSPGARIAPTLGDAGRRVVSGALAAVLAVSPPARGARRAPITRASATAAHGRR